MTLQDLMKPKPLSYYKTMVVANQIGEVGYCPKVALNHDQAAAILKAHDHGIAALAPEEVALLDQVMSKLKDEIWP